MAAVLYPRNRRTTGRSSPDASAVTTRAQIGYAWKVLLALPCRLYSIATRKRRASEAVQYNSLVGNWVEFRRMASADVPVEKTGLLRTVES